MQASRKKRAFTLIEVMVIGCVAIILMVLCVPSIREARASNLAQLQLMKLAVNTYNNNGQWDVEAPVVDCSVSKQMLGKNGRMVNVGLSVSAVDALDPAPTVEIFVYSDEGNGLDASLTGGPETLELRAERDPNGDGRVYLIVAVATDDCGNVGYNCCTVIVPLSKKKSVREMTELEAALAEAECMLTGSAPAGYITLIPGPV